MVYKLTGDMMDKYEFFEMRVKDLEEANNEIFREMDKLHRLAIVNRNQIKNLKTDLKRYKERRG